jgi:hypothetical protein
MRSRWLLAAVCFVVLPCLPAIALALLDAGSIPIFRDRIVVILLVAIVATLLSAALALRAGRRPSVAGLYGLATATLSVVAVSAVVVLILAAFPSED